MRPARWLAVVGVASACGAAGCGGGAHTPTVRLPAAAAGGRAGTVSGAAVFARSCRGCHSLVGNESLHTSGGDLVGYGLGRSAVLEYTREMPLRRPLSAAELRVVVAYVVEVERRGRARR